MSNGSEEGLPEAGSHSGGGGDFFFFGAASGDGSGSGGSLHWTPASFRTGGAVMDVPEARLLPFLLLAAGGELGGEGGRGGGCLGLAPLSLLLVELLEEAEPPATSN